MKPEMFLATIVAAPLVAAPLAAAYEQAGTAMVGAQLTVDLGVRRGYRLMLGSTVPIPGEPELFSASAYHDDKPAGLTNGRYLPLTGLGYSPSAGFGPVILGIELARPLMYSSVTGAARSGASGWAWLAGGAALALGAAAASGGGSSGDDSPPPVSESPNSERTLPTTSYKEGGLTGHCDALILGQCTPNVFASIPPNPVFPPPPLPQREQTE